MSRSNTFYYNICYPTRRYSIDWYVDGVGICSNCRGYSRRRGGVNKRCVVEKDIQTRRGIWKRRRRFKDSCRAWQNGPPADLKQIWHKQARAQQKQEFMRNPDDPMITPMKRLINHWDWY